MIDRGNPGAFNTVDNSGCRTLPQARFLAGTQHDCREAQGRQALPAGFRVHIGEVDQFPFRRHAGQCKQRLPDLAPRKTQQGIGRRTRIQGTVGNDSALAELSVAFALRLVHGLRLALDAVGSVDAVDQRQVQRIEPYHRPLARVTMLVPQARRCENQVAFLHRQFLARYHGKPALPFDNEADSRWRVPVVRRRFAGQDELHADIDGCSGLHVLQTEPGIAQHQYAAFRLLDGSQFAGT
jgi:hypothetical protein